MNKITPQLWVTDIRSVQNGDTSRFDVVVSVCQDHCKDNVSCEYEHYTLTDGLPTGHNRGTCSFELFVEAVDSVVEHVREGRTVLVHCHAGRSRSVAVCIAAYAICYDASYNVARDHVIAARAEASPNYVLQGFAKEYVNISRARGI